MRTSLQISQNSERSRERHGSVAFDGSSVGTQLLGSILPKLEIGSKQSSTHATEVSFLAYSELDIEHDFLTIVEQLGTPRFETVARRWPFRDVNRPLPPLKVVVVIDELDKVSNAENGLSSLVRTLISLKNILISPGIHFVLVGGCDLLDHVESERSAGDGALESVLSWQVYVPCIWEAAEQAVRHYLGERTGAEVDVLRGYLGFSARGLPRRLLYSVNKLASFRDGRANLLASHAEFRAFEIYHRCHLAVEATIAGSSAAQTSSRKESDRQRLGLYLFAEWILSNGGRSFELRDIQGAVDLRSIGATVRTADLLGLLDQLVSAGLLETVEPSTFVFDQSGSVQAYQTPDLVVETLTAVLPPRTASRPAFFGPAPFEGAGVTTALRWSRPAVPATSRPPSRSDRRPPPLSPHRHRRRRVSSPARPAPHRRPPGGPPAVDSR